MTGPVPTGLLLVTDRSQARRSLTSQVAAVVRAGVRWVLLRERDLPGDRRRALADRLRTILDPVGGRLIVAGPDPLGGTAVHLPAPALGGPPALAGQPGLGGGLLVGRSCHDATELARVTTEDYVTLSPVFASRSKPGYGPALGPAGLAELSGRSRVPVLALGGVETPERVAACVAAGAAGVAVMGALMRADDPGGLARTLLAAADQARPSRRRRPAAASPLAAGLAAASPLAAGLAAASPLAAGRSVGGQGGEGDR
ncbi:thiamine phosphate synthase [Solwaraspora sp. WMMD1047]|uniref:thiamine phosphate synthase n=1 Tax=Solwaraspora sp. WMMD1047 TaxID=3016102 RepID=UPI002416CC27|nr:thiamine phosphate synthase [Solwaraspora sp. WMMD1047]MDG4828463.1 thiamine phosphate synthase [Solwaraspora sp. WMMD1047]